MRYPVNYEKDGEGYLVTFPDIPEALTGGNTLEEAQTIALDALVTAFEFYFEDGRQVPKPGAVVGDYVEVPPSIEAKILLLNTLVESGITYAELARRMGTQPQAVQRLINLHHTTKIDTIYQALAAIGKQLKLEVA